MAFLWSEELETGNEVIDQEHQQLLETTNEFLLSCSTEQSKSKMKETIEFLIHYIEFHFANEEVLLHKYQYPAYEPHKKQHEHFKKVIIQLYEDMIESGIDATKIAKLHAIIVEWITKHIKSFDKAFVDFLKRTT